MVRVCSTMVYIYIGLYILATHTTLTHTHTGCERGKARRLMLCCWRHSVTQLLRSWWRTLVILLTPLIFLPLALPLDWNVNVRPIYT